MGSRQLSLESHPVRITRSSLTDTLARRSMTSGCKARGQWSKRSDEPPRHCQPATSDSRFPFRSSPLRFKSLNSAAWNTGSVAATDGRAAGGPARKTFRRPGVALGWTSRDVASALEAVLIVLPSTEQDAPVAREISEEERLSLSGGSRSEGVRGGEVAFPHIMPTVIDGTDCGSSTLNRSPFSPLPRFPDIGLDSSRGRLEMCKDLTTGLPLTLSSKMAAEIFGESMSGMMKSQRYLASPALYFECSTTTSDLSPGIARMDESGYM